MHDDLIREHIGRLDRHEDQPLIADLLAHCWPGGLADRSEPVAMRWLRQWHPVPAAAALPVCSCAAGHCAVCN